MKITIVPILQDLRELYRIPDRMDRFHEYVALLSGETRGEPLPIGNLSPMGQRQADYLDCLLRVSAELEAEKAVNAAISRLPARAIDVRMMLIVIDEPRNGWTQRSLTDADWRFCPQVDLMPKSKYLQGIRPWVSVHLWTDVEPTSLYVQQETKSALYRHLHRLQFGTGDLLREMITQEGRTLAFAGVKPTLGSDELEDVRVTLKPYLDCRDYPVCFAALYGDAAAKDVGYEPLGLPKNAGFELGITEALGAGSPELVLSQA